MKLNDLSARITRGKSRQRLRCGLIQAVHKVPVGVQSCRNRGMTQSTLNGFGMLPGSDQPGRMSVPKIMETDAF